MEIAELAADGSEGRFSRGRGLAVELGEISAGNLADSLRHPPPDPHLGKPRVYRVRLCHNPLRPSNCIPPVFGKFRRGQPRRRSSCAPSPAGHPELNPVSVVLRHQPPLEIVQHHVVVQRGLQHIIDKQLTVKIRHHTADGSAVPSHSHRMCARKPNAFRLGRNCAPSFLFRLLLLKNWCGGRVSPPHPAALLRHSPLLSE